VSTSAVLRSSKRKLSAIWEEGVAAREARDVESWRGMQISSRTEMGEMRERADGSRRVGGRGGEGNGEKGEVGEEELGALVAREERRASAVAAV